MDRNDQQAIGSLFDKLSTVAQQYPERDAAAEKYIHERVTHQPDAPYYMAQTIVVQEQSLAAAQERIAALEQQMAAQAAAPAGRGLFGGLFGGSKTPSPAPAARGYDPRSAQPTQPAAMPAPAARGGGGFLAGAAQTAVGVAGGMMLGNALGSMFGGDEAQAAEPAAPEPDAEPAAEEDAGEEDGGFFDMEW